MNPEEIYCELRTLQLAHIRVKAELVESQRKQARAEELIDHLLERLRAGRGNNVSREVV